MSSWDTYSLSVFMNLSLRDIIFPGLCGQLQIFQFSCKICYLD